jgi:hypothetical protein
VEPAKTLFGKVRTLHSDARIDDRNGFQCCLSGTDGQTRRLPPRISNETNTLTFFVTQIRRTYTGKIGGQNDDLAVTLQLAVSGIRCFYQNPKVGSAVEPCRK